MLDSSGSTQGYFNEVKKVIGRIIDNFNVSSGSTHVGFVVFSDRARVINKLDEYFDKDKIQAALAALPVPKGTTRLDLALQLTYRDLFATPDVAARKSSKFLVVITDGVHSSPSEIELAVKPFHAKGIKVLYLLFLDFALRSYVVKLSKINVFQVTIVTNMLFINL